MSDLNEDPNICCQLWACFRGCCCPGCRPARNKPLFTKQECAVTVPKIRGTLPLVHPIPKREYNQWSATVKLRYMCQVINCTCCSWCRACCCEKTEAVDDEEFANLFNFTILSTFLNPQLDQKDLDAFKSYLPSDYSTMQKQRLQTMDETPCDCKVVIPSSKNVTDDDVYYKADYSLMKQVNPLPGTYVADCVALFKRETNSDVEPLVPLCIKVDDKVFTPKDGQAWEIAKTYLLQGSAYDILFVEHPSNAHLPMSIVNGHTKTILPQNHVLFQLLYPHFYLHMGVNDSVRYGKNSVALMETKTPFNCFTFHGEHEALKFFQVGTYGLEGNSSYLPYRFTLDPPNIPSLYGRFLRSFYPEVQKFVEIVMAGCSEKDPHVVQWADAISQQLPGFPTGTEFMDNRSVMIQAITKVIWLESVEHSTTHHSFGKYLPRNKIPFRIRVPPPKDEKYTFEYKNVTTWQDRALSMMAWYMFFLDQPILTLKHVKYEFTDPQHKAAAKQFYEDMRKTGAKWGTHAVIPVDRMACSVQY